MQRDDDGIDINQLKSTQRRATHTIVKRNRPISALAQGHSIPDRIGSRHIEHDGSAAFRRR